MSKVMFTRRRSITCLRVNIHLSFMHDNPILAQHPLKPLLRLVRTLRLLTPVHEVVCFKRHLLFTLMGITRIPAAATAYTWDGLANMRCYLERSH